VEINTISVIGSGTMGNGIAHVCGLNGFNTFLVDIDMDLLDNAVDNIELNLSKQLSKGLISKKQKNSCLNNITKTISINDIIDSDLVIEAIPENQKIKENLFKELDIKCKTDTILASNTSSISITELSNITNRPDKVIGMHFMNPVPIMKLVEVISTKETSDSTKNSILSIVHSLSKTPVQCNDFPGFISNRILMPMINEAIYCLEQGVATKEAIDEIMVLGMAHPMGPLRLADLIGLDVCLSIMEVLLNGFNDKKYKASRLLREMVKNGNLGRKSGQGFYKYI
tara:strand:+ start:988 stop:1839 length:852 start_codon:yes stop_codon:yes gene_type:complete